MSTHAINLSAYLYLTDYYGLAVAHAHTPSFHVVAAEFAAAHDGTVFGSKNGGPRFDETLHAFILDRYGLDY